jgi:RNA polymerase sigma factor (sigma-70 family)
MDERTLWVASLGGDDRAFAELFDAHQGRVVRHAARVTVGRHDAEDVAAMAFLELWRLRRRVRLVNDSILPWLLATTTNIALNQSRSLRRYERMLRLLPRDADVPPVDDWFDDLASPELTEAIRNTMKSMAPIDATLLALTALEGMSTADAARASGITPNAARVRLHRAKALARQTLTIPEVTP